MEKQQLIIERVIIGLNHRDSFGPHSRELDFFASQLDLWFAFLLLDNFVFRWLDLCRLTAFGNETFQSLLGHVKLNLLEIFLVILGLGHLLGGYLFHFRY